MLIHCIMALPDFDIDSIGFDNLAALMAMQWDSLIAEGLTHPSHSGSTASANASTPWDTSSPAHKLLTEADQDKLTKTGGCWQCCKDSTDPGWVLHVGRTCPGDASQGILPGHDYVTPTVPVKKEYMGAIFSSAYRDDNGNDQPDYPDMFNTPVIQQIVGYASGNTVFYDNDTD
ncbi:hypothetical protein CVT25_001412 [Psilocybe cyanescens]|uniref:Uncharacterized protein n=1 Tax=Psilocybe cyanescens TaxID=93625 RepID=A0A409WNB7_PSICY|nr:hypothetical protein CVT25_001412 [Psilocybe cyanescens]